MRQYLWVLTEWCTLFQIQLRINHLPGEDNEWADVLSRKPDPAPLLHLDPNKRFRTDLRQLLFPPRGIHSFPKEGTWAPALTKHATPNE